MSPASQSLVKNQTGGHRVFSQLGVFPLGWERDAGARGKQEISVIVKGASSSGGKPVVQPKSTMSGSSNSCLIGCLGWTSIGEAQASGQGRYCNSIIPSALLIVSRNFPLSGGSAGIAVKPRSHCVAQSHLSTMSAQAEWRGASDSGGGGGCGKNARSLACRRIWSWVMHPVTALT